jgi:hypothetical protein
MRTNGICAYVRIHAGHAAPPHAVAPVPEATVTRPRTSPVSALAPRAIEATTLAGGSPSRHARRLALGWAPPAQLDRAGWLVAGISLAEFGRVNNWWVGDWVRYGDARWGEKYTEAARITGLDSKTLRNIAYVASRFRLSRRRDNLTWTHHAEVAALAPDQQDEWLDRAVALRLSPGDLRLELRAAQRALRSAGACCENADASDADGAEEDTVMCPRCGNAIRLHELRGTHAPRFSTPRTAVGHAR